VARRAEELDLDGVFVFDHVWPMGAPDRPALSAFPVLGAVAASTGRICFGPLVARVGLVPDAVLVAELLSLDAMARGRVIAGLGTGDAKSAQENFAYGVDFAPAEERRGALAECARHLLAVGVPVWVGGGAVATTELAVELGAVVNVWDRGVDVVRALRPSADVTWAGPVPGDVAGMARRLQGLAEAGASWVVCAWPGSLDAVAEATALVRAG
jgi:alkanesulfonate monooxygenase SsuD/methylene tetrahydromethanopterin reductase-like flavin-dependent oxidoreductase (luciferase family)